MRIDDVSILCLLIDSVLSASAPLDTVNVGYTGLVSNGADHFGKICCFGSFSVLQRELVN